MKSIVDRINSMSDIPPLPDSVNGVIKAIRDPKVSARDITGMIANDVAISSKILKVVNSAYYGFKGNISSITHAIVILGFNVLKSLVMSFSVYGLIEGLNSKGEFSLRDFWYHSVGVACASKVLSEALGFKNGEEFFTLGLLHDAGKLVLYRLEPELFLHIVSRAKAEGRTFFEVEREEIDIPHPDIAGMLFEAWQMPDNIVEAAALHHDIDVVENKRHVAIVMLADTLIKEMGIGNAGDDNKVVHSQQLVELLLEDRNLDEIKDMIREEIQRAEVFMQLMG